MPTPQPSRVEQVIASRERRIGEHTVGRILPAPRRATVGPFIFLDHMGPWATPPGSGVDVLPHPHIGLSTVTYLFDGEIVHRDSLGSEQAIRPGDINWMTAGRGIVHSERTSATRRAAGGGVHGLQFWVALPKEDEECEPAFDHYPAATLPEGGANGVLLRVMAGRAFGLESPVRMRSRLFYVEATLESGATLPVPDDYAERALYVVEGAVLVEGARCPERHLPVLSPGAATVEAAGGAARVVLFGGDALDGARYIDWNFVSSSRERIEEAKRAWRAREFPFVPGDETEFVPLPEFPHRAGSTDDSARGRR